MRNFARWTTRFVLAAATAITITVTGTGAAYADNAESAKSTPATSASTPATGEPTNAPLDNFPWG